MPKGVFKNPKERSRKLSIANSGRRNGMYGKKHTKETKRKMSLAGKGKKKSVETCRKMSESLKKRWLSLSFKKKVSKKIGEANRKRIISEDTRKKMSKTRTGRANSNWKGGKSFEPYNPEFNDNLKRKIRKRDNYTCQECGYTKDRLGYKLSIHHIDYNKKNNMENNLVSLCKPCHSQTNFSREDWTKYFQDKAKDIAIMEFS